MKKLTIALSLLALTVTVIGQDTTKKVKQPIDSNSIALFSVNDLIKFKALVSKTPQEDYIKIDAIQLLNAQIGWLINAIKPKALLTTGKK